MNKTLAGIKVIEIAQEVAGPFAGLFLADLGAEVVKIENKKLVIPTAGWCSNPASNVAFANPRVSVRL